MAEYENVIHFLTFSLTHIMMPQGSPYYASGDLKVQPFLKEACTKQM
jgi:hypothetical protein